MSATLQKTDKIRPAHGTIYRTVLFLYRFPLAVDILITTMTVVGRYIPFIPDPAWNEEVIPTYISYMAVFSAAPTTRRGAYVCMTAFDRYLPPKLVRSSDIMADLAVPAPAAVIITVGWEYVTGVGAKDTYASMPKVSRFWMYLSVSLVGVAVLVFEVEVLYSHVKSPFVKEGMG